MVRGIERRAIFADDCDRMRFVERLGHLVVELDFRLFAWALMPNHLHLAIRSGPVSISRLMARLGTGYARYFNRRHDRAGHVFQNRFRSRRIADDLDLMGVVLYVHRNPLEGGLVRDAAELETFPWCGHGAVVGARPPRPFEACRAVLELFSEDPAIAVEDVRRRVAEPGATPAADPPAPTWGRRGRSARAASDLADLIGDVCARHGVLSSAALSGGKSPRLTQIRAEIAVRAVAELGQTGREIARALGVSESAVSRALRRPAFRGRPPGI